MDNLLQKIGNWAEAVDSRLIIGISGHGAAGKTTFANKLLDLLGRDEVNYVNTDPYIINSDVRRHSSISYIYRNKEHRFKMTACHPAAHHLPSLERDIRLIGAGLDFWTIDTPYMERRLVSSKNNVTIVEGMSVAFISPDLFDLKIYFYTDGETEFIRRSGRDTKERGMDIDYLQNSHEERRIQYGLFMHPYSQHFDIVIRSSNKGVTVEKNIVDFKAVRSR